MLFQAVHSSFRGINTIQKVHRSVSGFVQVQRGRRNKTHCQNDCLDFQTNGDIGKTGDNLSMHCGF